MERDYIAALARAYDDFFGHYTVAPVLTIETDDRDIVRHPEDLRLVLTSIRQKLESVAYQKPLL